jgi:hypothetical protein
MNWSWWSAVCNCCFTAGERATIVLWTRGQLGSRTNTQFWRKKSLWHFRESNNESSTAASIIHQMFFSFFVHMKQVRSLFPKNATFRTRLKFEIKKRPLLPFVCCRCCTASLLLCTDRRPRRSERQLIVSVCHLVRAWISSFFFVSSLTDARAAVFPPS